MAHLDARRTAALDSCARPSSRLGALPMNYDAEGRRGERSPFLDFSAAIVVVIVHVDRDHGERQSERIGAGGRLLELLHNRQKDL